VESAVWQQCLDRLQDELSDQQFNTWIRPLQAVGDGQQIRLMAPNRYVLDQVKAHFMTRITELVEGLTEDRGTCVRLEVGSSRVVPAVASEGAEPSETDGGGRGKRAADDDELWEWREEPRSPRRPHELNASFTFDSFVEGKSNEWAKAAAVQVAANAGRSYNPLLLYGGVGLGKTHLMQAVGNMLLQRNPQARVQYLHSQRFVQDMVRALQQGTMQRFMNHYRSLDALLIDDIQFFAKKLRSQEEFFHVFNALLERGHQMVLTCDRYPREVEGLEERLKSRFVWGLTVEVEPPELETRVAILMKKAEVEGVTLSSKVAFFVAERIRSNVRELEGALKRITANARFTGQDITVDQVRVCLQDLIAAGDRQLSIDNIQRTVAEYYNVRVADLLSKRRTRTVTRPRQMAMALAKELTSHSLPEIGDAFGGRDHTTVLHACRKVGELQRSSVEVAEDYKNLERLLTA